MRIRNHRDLLVWQKAIELVKAVYTLARALPDIERYALADQLRRSAVSVPSNIAEGHARRSDREFARYVRVALGSLAEVDTQIVLARELGYVEMNALLPVEALVVEIRKMLNGLLSSLQAQSNDGTSV